MDKKQPDFTAQQTAEWFDQRNGIITNSEFHRLMAYPDKITIDSELPKGAKTYIEETFWELADGFSKEVKAWTLEYGNRQEPKAKQKLANSIKQELIDCEFMMHPTLIYYGGSPELEPVLINGVRTTTEIKCPATGRSHDENIEMCRAYQNDNGVLLKVYPQLFWQVNGNMFLQETQMVVFVSYHETKLCNTDYLQHFFPRNEEAIKLMLIQLPKAFKYYCEYGKKHGVDVEKHLAEKHKLFFEKKNNTASSNWNISDADAFTHNTQAA